MPKKGGITSLATRRKQSKSMKRTHALKKEQGLEPVKSNHNKLFFETNEFLKLNTGRISVKALRDLESLCGQRDEITKMGDTILIKVPEKKVYKRYYFGSGSLSGEIQKLFDSAQGKYIVIE